MALCFFSKEFCSTAFEIILCRRIQYFCWNDQRRLVAELDWTRNRFVTLPDMILWRLTPSVCSRTWFFQTEIHWNVWPERQLFGIFWTWVVHWELYILIRDLGLFFSLYRLSSWSLCRVFTPARFRFCSLHDGSSAILLFLLCSLFFGFPLLSLHCWVVSSHWSSLLLYLSLWFDHLGVVFSYLFLLLLCFSLWSDHLGVVSSCWYLLLFYFSLWFDHLGVVFSYWSLLLLCFLVWNFRLLVFNSYRKLHVRYFVGDTLHFPVVSCVSLLLLWLCSFPDKQRHLWGSLPGHCFSPKVSRQEQDLALKSQWLCIRKVYRVYE